MATLALLLGARWTLFNNEDVVKWKRPVSWVRGEEGYCEYSMSELVSLVMSDICMMDRASFVLFGSQGRCVSLFLSCP